MGAFHNSLMEEGTWEDMYRQLTRLATQKGLSRRAFMLKLLNFYDELDGK
jgi:hypothetical protein